jgi:hypothetical protein
VAIHKKIPQALRTSIPITLGFPNFLSYLDQHLRSKLFGTKHGFGTIWLQRV